MLVIFTACEPERKHLRLAFIPFIDGSKVLTYIYNKYISLHRATMYQHISQSPGAFYSLESL